MMKKYITVMILLLVLCLLASCTENVRTEGSRQESEADRLSEPERSDVQSVPDMADGSSDIASGDWSDDVSIDASTDGSTDESGDISGALSELSSEALLSGADSGDFTGNMSYNGANSGEETSEEPPKPVHTHSYEGQSCTEGGVCSCGKVGKPLGHKMSKATCTSPATCSRCGMTEGEPLGHTYKGGYCKRCKDTNGPLSPEDAELFKRSNRLTDEQNAEALKAARALVDRINAALPNGSDFERIGMAAELVSQEYKKGIHVESGNYYHQAYGVLIKRESSCAGCCRTLGLLLSCMGYEWTHVNENKWNHQWVELEVNGELIWADGQIGWIGEGEYPFAEKVD